MNAESYISIAMKHLSDCEKYGISIDNATFEIMHMAEGYTDAEIKETFISLPSYVLDIAHDKIKLFKQAGEYYVISSNGASKDMSGLMARLSKLI